MKLIKCCNYILLVVLLVLGPKTLKAGNDLDTNKFVTLIIKIDNYVGAEKLTLINHTYESAAGQKFTLTTFNYFISNIFLTNKKGEKFAVPQENSYFLVKGNDSGSRTISLRVPKGKYRSVGFTLGVDSLRNTMDLSRRKGPLDPSGGMIDGMYWSWNSGYIFFKMEGESAIAPLDKTGQHKFRFHIGGFGGYNKPTLNNIKIVSIDLEKKNVLKLSSAKTKVVTLKADVLKVFNGEMQLDLSKNSNVMFGSFSALVAKNYRDMFSLISIDEHEN